MNQINTDTIITSVEDIFKPFENKNGEIEISENVNPALVMFIVMILGLSKTFLLVLTDVECPYCGHKLHRHLKVDFNLNNTVNMKKMTYKCSNNDCHHVITPQWSKYIEIGCNYTFAVKNFALDLGLICNVSYEKMSEIIYWSQGVIISRETLYRFRKEHFDEYVSKIHKKLEYQRKQSNIEFSNVLAFDEQYVLVMGEWMYKLTALDPVTGHIHDFSIATKEEFNREYVKNFLKPLVSEFNIKTIVTDGAKMYPSIMKELGVEHKLCNFHKMQNLLKKMLGKLISLNKKIKNNEEKIEENKEKIEEIEEQREGKIGRPPKEEQKIVDDKKGLIRENTKKRAEKRKYTEELDTYETIIDDVSLMLKSKSKETGIKRYNKIIGKLEEIPKTVRSTIKNMAKELDQLLLHTEYDNVPTTNNTIELYHLTTLNRHDKKKYKTKEGVIRETILKTIRWESRVVLGKIMN